MWPVGKSGAEPPSPYSSILRVGGVHLKSFAVTHHKVIPSQLWSALASFRYYIHVFDLRDPACAALCMAKPCHPAFLDNVSDVLYFQLRKKVLIGRGCILPEKNGNPDLSRPGSFLRSIQIRGVFLRGGIGQHSHSTKNERTNLFVICHSLEITEMFFHIIFRRERQLTLNLARLK